MSAALSHGSPGPGSDLVGTFHTFGEYGPAYEVVSLEDEVSVLVRVLDSDETLSYPIANVRSDPDA